MNKYRLVKLLVFAVALNCSACGGAAEKAGGDGKAAVATPAPNAVSPAPTAAAVSTPVAASPSTPAGGAASPPSTLPASASSNPVGAPPAKAPTPQIGSGGNDLFLFTKARAAVNTDPELKAANLIIEVKEGVVTLSGTVASAALKTKAEELARGAGPKAVKNQLRVSAGK